MRPDQRRVVQVAHAGEAVRQHARQAKSGALAVLLEAAYNAPDPVVRVMAAARALDWLLGKPRRERKRQIVDSRPFVIFASDLDNGEHGMGHNGGPALDAECGGVFDERGS